MFDFMVCVLYNPAPPPFVVSKYPSVTLPLKPVLCDKGCALRLKHKFPSYQQCVNQKPSPWLSANVLCEELWTSWHRGRLGLLRSICLSLSPQLWKPHLWDRKIRRSMLNSVWPEADHTRFRDMGNDTCRADCGCSTVLLCDLWEIKNSLSQPAEQPKASTLQGNASQWYLIQLFMFTVCFHM